MQYKPKNSIEHLVLCWQTESMPVPLQSSFSCLSLSSALVCTCLSVTPSDITTKVYSTNTKEPCHELKY